MAVGFLSKNSFIQSVILGDFKKTFSSRIKGMARTIDVKSAGIGGGHEHAVGGQGCAGVAADQSAADEGVVNTTRDCERRRRRVTSQERAVTLLKE